MMTFGKPLPDRRYEPRQGAYGILIDTAARVLVVSTEQDTFYLPGGGIEQEETPDEALAREFLEETGLTIACGPELGTAIQLVHCPDQAHGYKKICSFCLVERTADSSAVRGQFEHHWMGFDQAQAMLHEEAHRWAVGLVGPQI